jgi:hypothetical protein
MMASMAMILSGRLITLWTTFCSDTNQPFRFIFFFQLALNGCLNAGLTVMPFFLAPPASCFSTVRAFYPVPTERFDSPGIEGSLAHLQGVIAGKVLDPVLLLSNAIHSTIGWD